MTTLILDAEYRLDDATYVVEGAETDNPYTHAISMIGREVEGMPIALYTLGGSDRLYQSNGEDFVATEYTIADLV